jgi:transposase
MTLQTENLEQIPEETVIVAKAAFPKGNAYLRLRDELKIIYTDETFTELFPKRGQPAESPGRLALVTVLQFAEGLPDNQAADIVPNELAARTGFFSHLRQVQKQVYITNKSAQIRSKSLNFFRTPFHFNHRFSQGTDRSKICPRMDWYNAFAGGAPPAVIA